MKTLVVMMAVMVAGFGSAGRTSPVASTRDVNASPLHHVTVRCEITETRGIYAIDVVGDFFLTLRNGTVEALNLDDCSVKWSWKGQSPTVGLPKRIDDTVYVPVRDDPQGGQHDLVALDVMSGAEKWRATVESQLAINVEAGVLLVQGWSEIDGIDPGRGTILWRMRPVECGSDFPYPFQAGQLFLMCIDIGPTGPIYKLLAYDVRTGNYSWSLEFDDAALGPIANGPAGVAIVTEVLLSDQDRPEPKQAQIGIDVSTGKQLWVRDFESNLDIHIIGQTAYASGRMLPDTVELLVALDVATGQIFWNTAISGFTSTSARIEDTLLVGTLEKSGNPALSPAWRLHAYNIESGAGLWTRVLQQHFTDELEWVFAGGVVIFAEGHTLNAIDVETGADVWTFTDPAVYPGSPMAVGGDVVVISDNFEGRAIVLELPKGNR